MHDIFLPQFMDRRPYNEWESKKDDGRNWALAKAREIHANHRPEPLDPRLSAEMTKIITAAEIG
jgi:trimethylamine:corrinoid methyltransferase-like protein